MQVKFEMNFLKRAYVTLIFQIFSFGIRNFYHSNENSEKSYNKMIQFKDKIYSLYRVLTNWLSEYRQSYLIMIHFNNLKFFIRPLILSDIVMTAGVWEPYVKKIFNPKEGDIVIDIGAHIGTYSIPKSIDVGDSGRIIACEPDKGNFKILEKNIIENQLKNILLIKKAVSEFNGKIKLVSTEDPMLSSIEDVDSENTIIVDGVNVDTLVSEFSLNKIDWIKIDAEGHEINILKGSKQSLEKFKPKVIIETRVENQPLMKKLLSKYDYNIKYLSGEYFYCY